MTGMSGSGYLLLLCLLTVAECDLIVSGTVGNNVTLPCKYDVTHNSIVPICWGRGDLPNSKCNNQLISTDYAKVSKDSLESSRYRLLGDLEKGDVSLTILNVSELDSGLYGCRVEIYGWFNDHKNHIELKVQKATEPITFRTLDNVTSTEQTPSNYTQGTYPKNIYM
ncbi:Hepatitis A virus cellular receptor 1 [Merluccius polli]|uniref:Hepatitis A virus cellular receptor 1 n=1 Tax=Merluccius polli TaxID=89951 RepID=A0AA47M8N8_MERPO|nr:Hepatitis A virus cellular receptor 1 [Merluccius polli]